MINHKQIKDKNEFFEFDTMRQCSQCLGRVMRRKTDYGMMILADQRFNKYSRYEKLPKWIENLVINIAATYGRHHLRIEDVDVFNKANH